MRNLKDFEFILGQVMQLITRNTRFRCRPGLKQIIEENPRLVIAISHASPLSWIPAVGLLTAHFSAKGGGERVPLGVMDKFFYSVPILKQLAHFMTQSEQPLTFNELLTSFGSGAGTDLVVFPEGSNCFFGEPSVLQPFRSPRFTELAIQAGVPILVCAHRGSEAWGKTIPVETEWLKNIDYLPKLATNFLEARLRQNQVLTIPSWPQPMEKFDMICELIHLETKREDLSEDPEVRKKQIQSESDRIRNKMQALLDEIDQSDSALTESNV